MKESLDPAATAALLPFPALVDALRRAVDDVLARGGRAVATLCDVADWPAVQRAAREKVVNWSG